MRQLIFIVDGNSEVCHLVEQALQAAGYDVRAFSTTDVIPEIDASRPALALVALTFSKQSELALHRQLVRYCLLSKVRVILLLDEAAEEQRVLALESGADDCLVKPFSTRELVARVQAVLRRADFPSPAQHADPADIVIDPWAMRLSVRGVEIPTTTLEFRLLEYLARHRGQVFTRDFLLDAVWGDMQFISPRSVDACIRRIREKIEPDRTQPTLLKTVRGVGYRLDAVAAWGSASNQGCDCSACRSETSAARLPLLNAKRRRPSAAT